MWKKISDGKRRKKTREEKRRESVRDETNTNHEPEEKRKNIENKLRDLSSMHREYSNMQCKNVDDFYQRVTIQFDVHVCGVDKLIEALKKI